MMDDTLYPACRRLDKSLLERKKENYSGHTIQPTIQTASGSKHLPQAEKGDPKDSRNRLLWLVFLVAMIHWSHQRDDLMRFLLFGQAK